MAKTIRALWIIATLGLGLLFVIQLSLEARDPLHVGPTPDAPSYVQQAIQMAHGNFLTIGWVGEVGEHINTGQINPSRYPPGFSFALAIFPLLHNSIGAVMIGSLVITILLLAITGFVAGRIGGWPAAFVGVAIAGVSPFVLTSAKIVMADAFGTLLTVIAFWLVYEYEHRQGRPQMWILIALGTVIGYSVITKFALVLTLAAVVIAIRRVRPLLWIAIGGAPWVLILGLYQWAAYGSPLENGYDYFLPGHQDLSLTTPFALDMRGEGPYIFNDKLSGHLLAWVCPNCSPPSLVMKFTPPAITYPATLLGLYWIVLPPLFIGFGIYWIIRNWNTRTAQFAVALTALTVAFFIFYFSQGVRFMAPPAFVLLILSAAGIVDLAKRILRRRTRTREAPELADLS